MQARFEPFARNTAALSGSSRESFSCITVAPALIPFVHSQLCTSILSSQREKPTLPPLQTGHIYSIECMLHGAIGKAVTMLFPSSTTMIT